MSAPPHLNGATAPQGNPGNVIAAAGQQLIWDQGRERILIQTERIQGVVGKGGVIQLAAAGRGPLVTRLDIKTPFVSLLLTPLDDLPLAQSRHVLITALARDRRTGARYSLDGKSLLAAGTAPLLLEPVQATIKLAGPPPISIRPLDPYGVPKKETLGAGKDGSFQIDGRSRAYYYEVRR